MMRRALLRHVASQALMAGILLCSLPAVGMSADTDIIDVPLLYDVLKGATINHPAENTVKDQLRVLTRLINENIFENNETNINFTTVDDGIRLDRAPPGGGETSKLSREQRTTILNNGAMRLKESNGDKGLLIVIAEQANIDRPRVLGVCYQGQPVGIVGAGSGSVFALDLTTAHEIGHSLLLDHVPEVVANRTNLMWHDNGYDGSKLTAAQIAVLRKEALRRGKVKMKPMPAAPAENKPQSLGISHDPDKMHAAVPDFQNIFSASMRAFGDETAYEVRLDLAGLIPTAGAATNYRMLFDSDMRLDTGALVDGVPGIDQILRIDLSDSGSPSYALQDALTLSTVSLAGAINRRLEFEDAEIGEAEFAEPHHDDLEIMLPKSLLPFSGGRFFDIPVLASALNCTVDCTTDLFELSLDLQHELAGPQLSADVGLVRPAARDVQLTGSNFTAGSLIDIFVHGTLLQTVNADSSGGFLSTIELPADALDSKLLYINAVQQGMTDYGFTAVHVVPEPASVSLFLAAATLLIAKSFVVRGRVLG